MVLVNPIEAGDVCLLDTSDWTAEDWDAAIFLAAQLKLQNAAKRAAGGESNQGPIRGMFKGPLIVLVTHS
jgi:hypothetical protein